MKKIICPTDFSPTANNAIEYAGKLAQKLNADLELIHIQTISSATPIESGLTIKKNSAAIADQLEKICEEVTRTFGIRCNYILGTTSNTIEKAIGSKITESTMVVMGTNGTDDLYQYIFGTNTYHLIQKSKCPVLVIPEGISYNTTNKIVLAWDYNHDGSETILKLKEVLGTDKAEITCLHIGKEKTTSDSEKFDESMKNTLSRFEKEASITFEKIYSESQETVAAKISDYAEDTNADMLVITNYDRGVLRNLFHGRVVKELSETATRPLLVLNA